eukprot:COSAG01_NODE_28549_length_658_cov_1.672630_3_plen_52_part_01
MLRPPLAGMHACMSAMLSRTPRYFLRSAEEDDELGLAGMRTEMGADGEWKAP